MRIFRVVLQRPSRRPFERRHGAEKKRFDDRTSQVHQRIDCCRVWVSLPVPLSACVSLYLWVSPSFSVSAVHSLKTVFPREIVAEVFQRTRSGFNYDSRQSHRDQDVHFSRRHIPPPPSPCPGDISTPTLRRPVVSRKRVHAAAEEN